MLYFLVTFFIFGSVEGSIISSFFGTEDEKDIAQRKANQEDMKATRDFQEKMQNEMNDREDKLRADAEKRMDDMVATSKEQNDAAQAQQEKLIKESADYASQAATSAVKADEAQKQAQMEIQTKLNQGKKAAMDAQTVMQKKYDADMEASQKKYYAERTEMQDAANKMRKAGLDKFAKMFEAESNKYLTNVQADQDAYNERIENMFDSYKKEHNAYMNQTIELSKSLNEKTLADFQNTLKTVRSQMKDIQKQYADEMAREQQAAKDLAKQIEQYAIQRRKENQESVQNLMNFQKETAAKSAEVQQHNAEMTNNLLKQAMQMMSNNEAQNNQVDLAKLQVAEHVPVKLPPIQTGGGGAGNPLTDGLNADQINLNTHLIPLSSASPTPVVKVVSYASKGIFSSLGALLWITIV